MACVARNLLVFALENVLCILVVVELRRLEGVVRMTIAALLAEAPGVGVLCQMAPMAIRRQFVLIPTGLVAAGAVGVRVRPQQGEARLFLMVEACGLPLAGRMARGAIVATSAAMDIVR